MHWRDIPFDPPTRTLQVFALGCVILLLVLTVLEVIGDDPSCSGLSPFGALTVVIGVIGWRWPSLLRPLFVAWMIAIFPINWLVSRLLLAFIFYGMITPLGLFFRLIGRDYLGRRFRPDQESYWMPKPTSDDVDSYLRPF